MSDCETCEEKSNNVSGSGDGGDGLARVPDTPHLSSSTHGPRPNLQVGTVNYYTASASKPMPPASAFPHPPSQSGTGAFRYRTESFYSSTKLVPASALIFFPVPDGPDASFPAFRLSGILKICTKIGSSVWVAAQLRGCSSLAQRGTAQIKRMPLALYRVQRIDQRVQPGSEEYSVAQ
jgi:hypothetical protein